MDFEGSSYFDDDNEEDADSSTARRRALSARAEAVIISSGGSRPTSSTGGRHCEQAVAGQANGDEEPDPLDAFMESIAAELGDDDKEAGQGGGDGGRSSSRGAVPGDEKPLHEQFEIDDPLTAFYEFVASKNSSSSTKASGSVPLRESAGSRIYPTIEWRKAGETNPPAAAGAESGVGGMGMLPDTHGDDGDSDEDVYEVAKVLEGIEAKEAGLSRHGKKEPLSLPEVDHSLIAYEKIVKDVYKEHPDITAMTLDDVVDLKASISVSATGFNIPRPIASFVHVSPSLNKVLFSRIVKKQFETPTAIQAQTIPIALQGRDVIGLAETGSGKTASYLLPAVQHVIANLRTRGESSVGPGRGPMVLILAPTRELAMQIGKESIHFAKGLDFRVSVLSGGFNKRDQFQDIKAGIEIAVGNPGRVIDLARMKNGLSFRDVTFLILDEADRMFSLGFEKQVRCVCQAVRPDRQTALFSATMPNSIERLARDVTSAPVRVTVGLRGQAAAAVEQDFAIVDNEEKKWSWLESRILDFLSEGQVLIFCNSQSRAAEVKSFIENLTTNWDPSTHNPSTGIVAAGIHTTGSAASQAAEGTVGSNAEEAAGASSSDTTVEQSSKQAEGVVSGSGGIVGETGVAQEEFSRKYVACLHGDLDQTERMRVLSQFRRGALRGIVATDVAARGLDIPLIQRVVSIDAAKTIDTHTHRIGRTGRAGRSGRATTILRRGGDNKLAAHIVEALEALGKKPPPPVLDLALTFGPFRAARLAGQRMALRGSGRQLGTGGLGYNTSEELPNANSASQDAVEVASSNSTEEPTGTRNGGDRERKRIRRWDSGTVSTEATCVTESRGKPELNKERQQANLYGKGLTMFAQEVEAETSRSAAAAAISRASGEGGTLSRNADGTTQGGRVKGTGQGKIVTADDVLSSSDEEEVESNRPRGGPATDTWLRVGAAPPKHHHRQHHLQHHEHNLPMGGDVADAVALAAAAAAKQNALRAAAAAVTSAIESRSSPGTENDVVRLGGEGRRKRSGWDA